MSIQSSIHERWISWTLRGGVWLSAGLLTAGLFLQARTGETASSGNLNLHQVILALAGNAGVPAGETILYAGLLALLLTPVLRVFSAAMVFWAERDWKFTLISAGVFAALALEIFLSF